MLKLVLYFIMGIVSEIVICKYTISLARERTRAVVFFNSAIFIMNMFFVKILYERNIPLCLALLVGESVGIIMALELKFDKKVINREG
jgi:hypothetical protein